MLTREDKESIHVIVREELDKALEVLARELTLEMIRQRKLLFEQVAHGKVVVPPEQPRAAEGESC